MNLLRQSMPLATVLFNNHGSVWIESSMDPRSNHSRLLFRYLKREVQMDLCRSSCGVVYIAVRRCEGQITTFDNRVVLTYVCTNRPHSTANHLIFFLSFLHQADLVIMFMYHVEWSMSRLVFHVTWFTNVLSYFVQDLL